MTIAQDKKRYFWLTSNDPTTKTEPEPATFGDSWVTPLVDMKQYMQELVPRIKALGANADPSKNAGEFIYIAGWWLGLLGGKYAPAGLFSPGTPSVEDKRPFDVDPGPGVEKLIDLLKEKARRGVDVRVLGWVSYSLMGDKAYDLMFIGPVVTFFTKPYLLDNDMARINGETMNSIKNLRSEPKMAKKAMLNVLGHPAGAVHVKMAVVGKKPDASGDTDAVGFTGGLDLEQTRWADVGHAGGAVWHDVQAMVRGKAVQAFYDHFRALWNESLKRDAQKFRFEGKDLPSYVDKTPEVPKRTMKLPLPTTPSVHHVQSLRTVPAFNFRWYNCLPEGKAASFAKDGLFEVRAAWRKALLGAQTYIYMEDQAFESPEILGWVNQAIKSQPNLKVILMMGGGTDPNDPKLPDKVPRTLRDRAFNKALLKGLSPMQIENQVRAFQAWGQTGVRPGNYTVASVTAISATESKVVMKTKLNPKQKELAANALKGKGMFFRAKNQSYPIVGNAVIKPGAPIILHLETLTSLPMKGDKGQVLSTLGIFMHSKVTIVDDKWAIIGSSNILRRSLYTDWEHSISFLDDGGDRVAAFREELWAEHFKADTPYNTATSGDFKNLQAALGAWSPLWIPSGVSSPSMPKRVPGDLGPPFLKRIMLPLPVPQITDEVRNEILEWVDELKDIDSRKPWGGVCPPTSTPS